MLQGVHEYVTHRMLIVVANFLYRRVWQTGRGLFVVAQGIRVGKEHPRRRPLVAVRRGVVPDAARAHPRTQAKAEDGLRLERGPQVR